MWYFVTITRQGEKYFVISPAYGKYELSPTKERNTYLWETRSSAESDKRWQHLIQSDDVIEYNRTYEH